jgi:hypothetical protein
MSKNEVEDGAGDAGIASMLKAGHRTGHAAVSVATTRVTQFL